jgi:NADH:ubiquinone oxidoreductase subunit E
MEAGNDPLEVKICMGSSCFARGNAEHLALLKKHALCQCGKLKLTGSLCQEHCKQGPNMAIGSEEHHGVSTAELRDLLQQLERKQ